MVSRTLHRMIVVLLLVFLAACSGVVREELGSVSLVVIGGTVIDGTGADPIPDGLVAVQGNRIVAVGSAADFKIPDDAVLIDAAGGTILPGIFNAHAHKDMGAGTRRIMFLLDGVTSVCDMMTPILSMHYLDEAGIQSGPAARGFKSGPMITVPGGYPGVIFGKAFSYDIQGKDQAEKAVLDISTQGADYIKVALEPGIFGDPWPVLNLEELSSIVETAHAQGLLVRAHVNNAKLDLALDGGVDVIEHVPLPTFSHEELGPFFDDAGVFQMPPEMAAQADRMVADGIILVPTLDVIINDTRDDQGDIPPEVDIVNQAILGVVRYFHDAGGIIALGNDYGSSGVDPGMPLREMELLQAAGLSPMEIIVSATKQAAIVCGQSDDLGTLEVGKLADLIVMDGNPLEDIHAFDSLVFIVKDGEIALSPGEDNK